MYKVAIRSLSDNAPSFPLLQILKENARIVVRKSRIRYITVTHPLRAKMVKVYYFASMSPSFARKF